MEEKRKVKIIFSGGGTLGPVMPLLAVFQELKKRNPAWEFLWVGTKTGPEKELVKKYGLEFKSLISSKLRRYWSWRNLLDVFNFKIAFWQSLFLIGKWQPDILITAGGFVSVPLHLAAWFLGKKTLVHQQDVKIGLANKLMAHFANFISTSLEKQLEYFPRKRSIYLGNPVREGLKKGSREEAIKFFMLEPDLPTILILGGGTGALSLNRLIVSIIPEIINLAQVIHMTGSGKEVSIPFYQGQPEDQLLKERYHPVRFLDERILAHALAAADLVICRAGFSTLSELSTLGKPFISAPIPQSHQLDNAEYFLNKCGAPVFYSDKDSASKLAEEIKNLLNDPRERIFLGRDLQKAMLKNARERMAILVEEAVKKEKSVR